MDCTNQDIVGKNCVRNDAGGLALTDYKMKAWVEHYARLLNVEFGQATSSLMYLQLLSPLPCVCNTDPQSTQQNEMQQGCWSIWHCSWDAESCWWGRSWAGKTTDRGCFQLWYDPIRLGGELNFEPLQGQRWSPWPWQLLWSQAHRSSHEAAGVGTSATWWTLMKCSLALYLVEVPLTPSSLFANCRSTSQQRCVVRGIAL